MSAILLFLPVLPFSHLLSLLTHPTWLFQEMLRLQKRLDSDTDIRLKQGLTLPERVDLMTKYTYSVYVASGGDKVSQHGYFIYKETMINLEHDSHTDKRQM